MATHAKRLVVIGDANPDLVLTGADLTPEFGQVEKLVDRADLVLGGSAAITAAAAARLGAPTSLVAAVGSDPMGDFVLAQVAATGADVTAVMRAPGPTGVTVVLSRGDDRAILTAPGVIDFLDAALVASSPALDGAAHVHVSSFYLQPRLAADLPELFAQVRGRGATTSLDTNFDPAGRWLTGELEALLRVCDLFFPNQAEAVRLTGQDDPVAAARWLADRYGLWVAVKCGAAGAMLHQNGQLVAVNAPTVAGVDATGAGDAFNAGFLTSWLRTNDTEVALRTAAAAGALATTGVGAASRLDRGAVVTLSRTLTTSRVNFPAS